MIKILGHVTDPGKAIASHLNQAVIDGLALSWQINAYWNKSNNFIGLAAILFFQGDQTQCIISDQHTELLESAESIKCYQDFVNLAKYLGLTPLLLDQPMCLDPLYIAKPWGQEIWYSGIEERGVCCAESIPLPWILSLAPEWITGLAYEDPILLKILDPHASPVYGDLYFEMHDKKKEVYVVTHIDEDAWTDGRGAVRFGFDEDKINSFASSVDFLAAYGEAVSAYQTIRNLIDGHLDEIRKEEAISEDQIVNPDMISIWLSSLPADLVAEEKKLRGTMESFTHLRLLNKGDVIQVPILTPHSLQHGVRVIEFQTPSYERYIISFSQKVLTQDHWDTQEALSRVNMEQPVDSVELISHSKTCRVEKIVSFDQFVAYRVTLEKDACYVVDFKTYCLIIGLSGQLKAGTRNINEEEAFYLTAMAPPLSLFNRSESVSSFLLAVPNKT